MSMAEVIESIEKDMWRDLESRSIPEIQPEMIDCTTLGEEPNSQHICGRISNGYSSKVPCISKDDSCEHWEGWKNGKV